MNTKFSRLAAAVLICTLMIAGVALAMSSDNFRLDWFTLATGGGAPATSSHYALTFTIGQTVIGASSSTNYGGCLGYWCGVSTGYAIRLPLILNFPSP